MSQLKAAAKTILTPCSSLTVQRAILEIDSRGLDAEGIYRVPGKLGLIQHIVQEIEQDEIMFEFDQEKHDVHTVAGVLKVRFLMLQYGLIRWLKPIAVVLAAAARCAATDESGFQGGRISSSARRCAEDADQATSTHVTIASSYCQNAYRSFRSRASTCGEEQNEQPGLVSLPDSGRVPRRHIGFTCSFVKQRQRSVPCDLDQPETRSFQRSAYAGRLV